jgi:hypothetical protein
MFIVGFKHNGNGIDWLREPITVVDEQHIKNAEAEAGQEVDAIIRSSGLFVAKIGNPPELTQIRIHRIKYAKR